MIDLLITPEQAELLKAKHAEAETARAVATLAEQMRDVIVAAIARGHGHTDANGFELEGRTLRIRVPEKPREDA